VVHQHGIYAVVDPDPHPQEALKPSDYAMASGPNHVGKKKNSHSTEMMGLLCT